MNYGFELNVDKSFAAAEVWARERLADIGLFIPFNVVITVDDDGNTIVKVPDAEKILAVTNNVELQAI